MQQQQRGRKRRRAGPGPGAEDTGGQQALLNRLGSIQLLLRLHAAHAAQKDAAAARQAAMQPTQPRRAMPAAAPAPSSGGHVLPIVGPAWLA